MVLAQGGGFNVIQSLQNAFSVLMGYIPQIIGALVVLVVGYIIAKLLRMGITKLLNKFRLDDRLKSGQGGQYVERLSPRGSPSRLVGTVVFAVLMVFVLSSAIGTLGIPALTGFMNVVLGYLPRVIAALLIFMAAVAIAGAVGGLVHRTMGDTPTGRMARTAGPTLVMAIGVFMILTQLRIAPVIVTITYVALVGAMALGSAIAFGLGGREAAADMINSGYRRAQQEMPTQRSGAESRAGASQERGSASAPEEERGATPSGGTHRAT